MNMKNIIEELKQIAHEMCEDKCQYQWQVDQQAWLEDRQVTEEEELQLYQQHCERCPMMDFLSL